jgi:hypothetical protein
MNHQHCEAVIWTLVALWAVTWFAFCHQVISNRGGR